MSPHRRPRARFVLRVESHLTAEELWERLWELSRHSSAVPLTLVKSADGAALQQGSRFVARTSLGPLHLDDRMVVREWVSGRAVVAKTGPLLTGTIRARVTSTPTGSRLLWQQEFGARGVPDALAALVRRPVAAGYERTLRRIIG